MTKFKEPIKALKFILRAMAKKRIKLGRKLSRTGYEQFPKCYDRENVRIAVIKAIRYGPGFIVEIDKCFDCHHADCLNRGEYIVVPSLNSVPTDVVLTHKSIGENHKLYYGEFAGITQIPVE